MKYGVASGRASGRTQSHAALVSSHPIGHWLRLVGDVRRRLPLHRMEDITMLHKTRIGLVARIAVVVAIVAVSVMSNAGSASALGFYRGGDFGLFGFDSP